MDLKLQIERKKIYSQKSNYYIIWLLNNQAIGHSNTNSIRFGESATMHLHIWHNKTRKTGLGMSSISDSWYGFAQNSKTLEAYTEAVNKEELPILKGFVLSKEDLIVREHILNIMCHFETRWKDNNLKFSALEKCLDRLKEMENDGLLIIDPKNEKLRLLEHARPYVRNVCIAFDLHLIQKKPQTKVFSMTI